MSQNQTSVRWTRSALGIALMLLLAAPVAAQTGTLSPQPKFTAFDSNGNPVSNGKLCTYTGGTVTPANTYTDATLLVANLNPVRTDSAGRADVWLVPGQTYKFLMLTAGTDATCATGTTIWTVDGIGSVPANSGNLDVLGTAGEAITAGQVVYLSDGSGSKTAGQWFKADATNTYSSTTGIVGLAPAAISSAASGTVRLGGTVTGLSGLSLGVTYYVSATPGAVTATAPTNNRRLLGVADTTSSLILNANPQVPPQNIGDCNGRLTLTTGTPVTTADVTAAGTLFFTTYKGNRCALFDGTWWQTRTFAELSIAVPATASQMFDVWLFDSAGTLSLELLAWTNDTTRATALTTQDGVLVKTGATTRRYLGSFRTTTVVSQTEDSFAKRYVYNYYNRVRRLCRVNDPTDTWTYTTAAWQQANANTANQCDFVVGVAEATVTIDVLALVRNDNAGIAVRAGIGEDVTNATKTGSQVAFAFTPAVNYVLELRPHLETFPAVGRHFYSRLEQSGAGVGTTTWLGDNGDATIAQSGISGWIE